MTTPLLVANCNATLTDEHCQTMLAEIHRMVQYDEWSPASGTRYVSGGSLEVTPAAAPYVDALIEACATEWPNARIFDMWISDGSPEKDWHIKDGVLSAVLFLEVPADATGGRELADGLVPLFENTWFVHDGFYRDAVWSQQTCWLLNAELFID